MLIPRPSRRVAITLTLDQATLEALSVLAIHQATSRSRVVDRLVDMALQRAVPVKPTEAGL